MYHEKKNSQGTPLHI